MTGGSLNSSAYGPYAQYFVKFVQAYGQQGITIEALAPQNEPGFAQGYPSALWPSALFTKFIGQNLGPAFTSAGLSTKIMAWYPGQRGGAAMGKLLWGTVADHQYNFSGKLPFTWGKGLSDYATFDGKGTTGHDYFVGYRKFDKDNITPLFPFGAGLSYTTYEYRKLQLGCSDMSKGAVLPVVVNVANTGTVAGDEIVMVFVSFPNTQARRPMKELKGFARVSLAPGEEKQISIPVRLSDLDYFQTDSADPTSGKWVVESGQVKIMRERGRIAGCFVGAG